jgi:hypothetical protein
VSAPEDASDPLSDDGPWPIRVKDLAPLKRLLEAVKSLARIAKCGDDFVALGEACLAIESILAGETFNVRVGLTIGFRRRYSEFDEYQMAFLRINSNAIVLDEMSSTNPSESDSDYVTKIYASLKRCGGFNESGIADWISRVEELLSLGAKLGTIRGNV